MKILDSKKYNKDKILEIIQNFRSGDSFVLNKVKPLIEAVKSQGDKALLDFSRRFDCSSVQTIKVTDDEIKEAWKNVDRKLVSAIRKAKKNVQIFHKSIIKKTEYLDLDGVRLWREFKPIEKVGLYIPGGTAAYFSTVLMLAVPAKIAGCQEIVMCTPAGKDGKCNPGILVAADICGVRNIFKVGGAQAIAAMAFGTESVPRVYKIFGPGNQYVATAKSYLQAFGNVSIDMPAGPSEVMVIADDSAKPDWIAADLLSQLEHGIDSQVILICFSDEFANKVISQIQKQKEALLRKEIIDKSNKISFAVIVKSIQEAIYFANQYAPEHLEIVMSNKTTEDKILKEIINAGSVFLGKYSSEPLGDYATGANHTLPTSSNAKMYSALSTESFGKYIQVQRVSAKGLKKLRPVVEKLAQEEGLNAHARAVSIRFDK